MVGVDIEEHLALHRKEVRELALEWANYDEDDADEAEQAILVLMWERHESGAYDHEWPNPHQPGEFVSLLGYVRPFIRGVALEEINEYKHWDRDEKGRPILSVFPNSDNDEEGIANFEGLQEQALEQGRDRLYLDSLYDSPMPGLKTPLEGTLSAEEKELAEKLKANLTDEELEVLQASYGRSLHRAAESLDMPYSNYYRRFKAAQAKAQDLAQGFSGS
jgi:hypothetical protein